MMTPQHPAWQVIYTVAIILSLSFALWLNASTFDQTEWKTIAEIGALVAAGKFGEHWWNTRLPK